jgi:hypothetical protein
MSEKRIDHRFGNQAGTKSKNLSLFFRFNYLLSKLPP